MWSKKIGTKREAKIWGKIREEKIGKNCEEKSWEMSDKTKRTKFGKKLKEM